MSGSVDGKKKETHLESESISLSSICKYYCALYIAVSIDVRYSFEII